MGLIWGLVGSSPSNWAAVPVGSGREDRRRDRGRVRPARGPGTQTVDDLRPRWKVLMRFIDVLAGRLAAATRGTQSSICGLAEGARPWAASWAPHSRARCKWSMTHLQAEPAVGDRHRAAGRPGRGDGAGGGWLCGISGVLGSRRRAPSLRAVFPTSRSDERSASTQPTPEIRQNKPPPAPSPRPGRPAARCRSPTAGSPAGSR